MQRQYDYTLQVGDKGSTRLELLNELCNPLSLRFISETVELRNKNILEIGCGIVIIGGV